MKDIKYYAEYNGVIYQAQNSKVNCNRCSFYSIGLLCGEIECLEGTVWKKKKKLKIINIEN